MANVQGGARLEAQLRRMAEALGAGGVLRVGFLENATYPSTPTKKLRIAYDARKAKGQSGAIAGAPGGTTVATIAAIQNFGAPRAGIPPRPFFTNMVADKQGEWPSAIAGLLVANRYNVGKALDIAGFAIAGQLRTSIINTNSPPLAASTIARKGFSKPLIDTSHMINSVDHEVRT
jgi:hypothetical protein